MAMAWQSLSSQGHHNGSSTSLPSLEEEHQYETVTPSTYASHLSVSSGYTFQQRRERIVSLWRNYKRNRKFVTISVTCLVLLVLILLISVVAKNSPHHPEKDDVYAAQHGGALIRTTSTMLTTKPTTIKIFTVTTTTTTTSMPPTFFDNSVRQVKTYDPPSPLLEEVKKEVEVLEVSVHGLQQNLSEVQQEVREDGIKIAKLATAIHDKEMETIGAMIMRPQAILYSGQHHEGASILYNNEGMPHPPCVNLGSLISQVNSVDTMDTCIRLFAQSNCSGATIALYSGSSQAHEQSINHSKFLRALSVGPCFENELEEASTQIVPWQERNVTLFKKSKSNFSDPENDDGADNGIMYPSRQTKKNQFSIPDMLIVGRPTSNFIESVQESIGGHKVGVGQRIEYLESVPLNFSKILRERQFEGTDRNGVKKSEVTTSVKTFFGTLDRKGTDVVGVAIGFLMGGPRDSNLNVFPQSREGRQKILKLEGQILKLLRTNPTTVVDLEINFYYPSATTGTRPMGLAYRVNRDGQYLKAHYIPNP